MDNKFDFSGWATKNDLKCSDGRIIRKDAFKHCDGLKVPLVWNHDHNDPLRVIGHALLENRAEGVYAYGSFNDTELGKTAKIMVQHGDITQLSIYANQLQQQGPNVLHGAIREVSLVLAGANPGAYIETVMAHSAEGPVELEDEAYIYTGEDMVLSHAEEPSTEKEEKTVAETNTENKEKTVKEVWDSMTEEQQNVCYAMIGQAIEDAEGGEAEHSENLEGGNEMKHNAFYGEDQETVQGRSLTHADQVAILELAKQSNVGTLSQAMAIYAEEQGLMHSEYGYGIFEDAGVLFPEYELLKKGEPETIERYDQSWVGPALRKIHKSPYSRIRTRFADKRVAELKAKGYQKKGDKKTLMGQITMINRTTDPQTIYIKDNMHRDDKIDITDFDVVAYQWRQMRMILDETMVLAAMVGDGREEDDPDKIHEIHVRPIWTDNEEYTIHYDVDFEAAKKELQGTNTGANFSDNYIHAEATIRAALYSREKYKGTGTPDYYTTPHEVNVMLLARDLNGRRIYDSKADLAKALNVNSIIEVEQFEGLTRTTEDGKTKELVGLFVNLADYTFGSTKGGEITKFEDFDMDFNVMKFMLETRLSGSLYKLKSAIALEKDVTEEAAG